MPETFLIVDGENIDATLGNGILGGKPEPEQRPRWDRIREYAEALWSEPVRGLFFLNVSDRLPMQFVQALTAIGYRPVLLKGPPAVKVVDIGIERTLTALAQRADGHLLLATHDGDFADEVAALLQVPGRRVGLIGFREFVSGQFTGLVDEGLEFHDLEDDVGAFIHPLPRIRVIDIADFDPWTLLG